MKIYWTYSRVDLKPSEVSKHEQAKVRFSSDTTHIGGLERKPILTHCVSTTGYLHAINYCPGNEIHIALIGGLDADYKYHNTATTQQLFTLGNIVRFYLSLGEVIEEGDLANFNLEQWLKAINK
jgi:hypothetical protein